MDGLDGTVQAGKENHKVGTEMAGWIEAGWRAGGR
jgi:hypothetical protein